MIRTPHGGECASLRTDRRQRALKCYLRQPRGLTKVTAHSCSLINLVVIDHVHARAAFRPAGLDRGANPAVPRASSVRNANYTPARGAEQDRQSCSAAGYVLYGV